MSRQNPNAEHASCTEMPNKVRGAQVLFPSQASIKSIHSRWWSTKPILKKGQNNVNRITLKPGTTRVQISQKVESRRGRPFFHTILTWTCWIDPTFCQKLTRYDSLGTEEILILSPIPFRPAGMHCICEQNCNISILSSGMNTKKTINKKCVLLQEITGKRYFSVAEKSW